MRRLILVLLGFVMLFTLFDVGLPYSNAIVKKTVDGNDNTIVYTENFEGYADSTAMKAALGTYWTMLDPQNKSTHQLISDPLNESNKVLYMNQFSGLIWKEPLIAYEFSADMKIDSTNDKPAHSAGSAFFIRTNIEPMGKPLYESVPEEGKPLGSSGIILYLWNNNVNILVRTYDEATGTIGGVVNFGSVRIPGKNARTDYVKVKVVDNGKGVIKLYIEEVLAATFTLSEEKTITIDSKTARFYTKLELEFGSGITVSDPKYVYVADNAFVAASRGTVAYATRNFGTYVGHYVDNIKLKTPIEDKPRNNAYTYLDLTDENVFNRVYDGTAMDAGVSVVSTEAGVHVSGVTSTSANVKNFLNFRFFETVKSTPGKDYYMAVKYKYDESSVKEFFTNGSSILTDGFGLGRYDKGSTRFLGALSNSANQNNVIELDDGWNVCFIRISMDHDKSDLAIESGYALVKQVRFCIMTTNSFTIESIAIFEDIYGFAGGNTSFNDLVKMEYAIPDENNLPIPGENAKYKGSQIRTVLVPYFKNGSVVEGEYRQGLRFVFENIPEIGSEVTYNGVIYTVEKQSALVILKSKLEGNGELILGNTSITPAILENLLDYDEASKAVYIYNIPEEHVDTVVVARVYLECKDDKGNTVYLYGEEKENSLRSVYEKMDAEARAMLDPDAAAWFAIG